MQECMLHTEFVGAFICSCKIILELQVHDLSGSLFIDIVCCHVAVLHFTEAVFKQRLNMLNMHTFRRHSRTRFYDRISSGVSVVPPRCFARLSSSCYPDGRKLQGERVR
jgi:hypothetical protein